MTGAMKLRSWIHLPAIALVAAFALATPARGQSIAHQQASLQLAVCLNDWDQAIARTSQLEEAPGLPFATVTQLADLRHQMQVFRQNQTVVSPIDGCEPVLTGFGLPGYTGRPLDFDRGVYSSVGGGSPRVVSDQTLRQYEALWQAGLGVTTDTPLPPLVAARRIDTRSGSGVSTGAVSRWIDVYAFLGAEGDTPHLALDVVQQRQGILYADDRSLLFLFDSAGRLMAEARTTTELQSRLEAVTLPATDLYYVAVTTPEHRPRLDEQGIILGWQGIGTSAITYTLTLRGLTPAPQLGQP